MAGLDPAIYDFVSAKFLRCARRDLSLLAACGPATHRRAAIPWMAGSSPAMTGWGRAPWRVAEPEALPGFRLRLRFRDGSAGFVEMLEFIHSDEAGVFAALRDKELFRQARVTLGAVAWPGDLDLAPDAMHRAIKQHGKWIVA